MTITLNGKSTEIHGDAVTVKDFVAGLELGKQPVLVELNGEAIFVREFTDHFINDGDVVEVIRMVAGG